MTHELIDPNAVGHYRRWRAVGDQGWRCKHEHTTSDRADDCALEHDGFPLCHARGFDEPCGRRAPRVVDGLPLCHRHAKASAADRKGWATKPRYTKPGSTRALRVVAALPVPPARWFVCVGILRRSKDGAEWRLAAPASSYAAAREYAAWLQDTLGEPAVACIPADAPGLEFVP